MAGGEHRVISSELHFIEIDSQGEAHGTVQAPYLDYAPLPSELARLASDATAGSADLSPQMRQLTEEIADWRQRELEGQALAYAVEHLVPGHVAQVRAEREALVTKTMAAVQDRLTKEIAFWDKRANDLKEQEFRGKRTRLSSGNARATAERLAARLQTRMAELKLERQVIPPDAGGNRGGAASGPSCDMSLVPEDLRRRTNPWLSSSWWRLMRGIPAKSCPPSAIVFSPLRA